MPNIKEIGAQIGRRLEPVNNFLDRNPEKEYLFGAFATYLYVAALFRLDILPPEIADQFKKARELTRLIPFIPEGDNIGLIEATAMSGTLTVDGARRIVLNRVPFIKAYLRYLKEDLASKLPKNKPRT